MFQPRTILCPTDFSSLSNHAFEAALDIAAQFRATVLVLHVADSLEPTNITFGEALSQLQPEGHQQRLWQQVRQVKPPPGCDVAVEYLVTEGNPALEIDRVAQEKHCDLIVMGTHGRTGLDRLLTGSTAEKAMRRAPCPILIMRAPAHEPHSK